MTAREIVGLFAWGLFAWGLFLIFFSPRLGLGLSLVAAAVLYLTRPDELR
jgi:hypothetical protein